jgi:hypothetical protein
MAHENVSFTKDLIQLNYSSNWTIWTSSLLNRLFYQSDKMVNNLVHFRFVPVHCHDIHCFSSIDKNERYENEEPKDKNNIRWLIEITEFTESFVRITKLTRFKWFESFERPKMSISTKGGIPMDASADAPRLDSNFSRVAPIDGTDSYDSRCGARPRPRISDCSKRCQIADTRGCICMYIRGGHLAAREPFLSSP